MKPKKAITRSLSKTLETMQYFPPEFRPGNLDNFLINSGLPIVKVNNKFFVQSLNGILYRIHRDNLLSTKQKKEVEVMREITFETAFILSLRSEREVFETALRNLLEVSPGRGTELLLIFLEETKYPFEAQIFKSDTSDLLFYEFRITYAGNNSEQVCCFLDDAIFDLPELPFTDKSYSKYTLEKIVPKVYLGELELFALNVTASSLSVRK